jgi:hypothetical protein
LWARLGGQLITIPLTFAVTLIGVMLVAALLAHVL